MNKLDRSSKFNTIEFVFKMKIKELIFELNFNKWSWERLIQADEDVHRVGWIGSKSCIYEVYLYHDDVNYEGGQRDN